VARKTILIVAGALWLAFGLMGFLVENNNHTACNSGLGTFGQALDGSVAHECAVDNDIWGLSIASMIGGVTLFIVGLVMDEAVSTNRPPFPPGPGWYPDPSKPSHFPIEPGVGWYSDPSNPSMLRWWDGRQWTATTTPRDG